MQIVKGNFSVINHPLTSIHLIDNEICIKDKETSLIYARSIYYNKFGTSEFNDRLLPVNFNDL